MSLNGIISNAVSGLKANTTALSVVGSNINNVNTEGYVRRDVKTTAQTSSGDVSGVDVDVTRTVDKYLDQETLTSQGTSSQYSTESTIYDELNTSLGEVGDGNSLSSQLSDITSALATASQTPSDSSSQESVLSSLKTFASKISSLYSSLTDLQDSADQQVSTTVDSANSLIKQVSDLNTQIRNETSAGGTASSLKDQRDAALQSLAKLMDIKTVDQPDGTVKVTTNDGTTLVGEDYAELSYSGGSAENGYDTISVSYINPRTGNTDSTASNFDSHLSSGTLEGLITMRDSTIGDLKEELGNLAKTAANAYNSVSNDYTASPPPTTLTGKQTGLLSSDSINFDGAATIAVTDSNGNLVSQGDVTINAGDSVDTIVSSINEALNGYGTATFTDGKLTITATDSSNGIVIQDESSSLSTTNDTMSLSEFFGLNDIFQTSVPTTSATGLDANGSCGVSDDGDISLVLKDASGNVVKTGSTTTITSGDTIQGALDKLSDSLDNAVTFTVQSDGSVSTTYASGYSGCSIVTSGDTTERGDTGVSFTDMFGIGTNVTSAAAAEFGVTDALSDSASQLPFAQTSITSTTETGANVVGSGDSSGAIALENVETATQTIAAAGNLSARSSSLSNYAGSLYQDVATRSTTASNNETTQSDRLTEAQSLQSSAEGVSTDEELSNMVIYQQAYSAAARLITTCKDLYDTLLSMSD